MKQNKQEHKQGCDMFSNLGKPSAQKDESYCDCTDKDEGVEPLIEVIEKTIEFNTDSIIGEDGTIVVDYAQLRDTLFSAMNTYKSQATTDLSDVKTLTEKVLPDWNQDDLEKLKLWLDDYLVEIYSNNDWEPND